MLLKAAEIVQAWQGSSPDLWDTQAAVPELGDYDPWSSSSSGSPF